MAGRRWTAKFSLAWTPVLTYTRARLELLDWFDENVDHVAFTEDHEHIGIAVGSMATRIVVHRSGASIELREPDADTVGLEGALDGVLTVLRPRDPHPKHYAGAWTASVVAESSEACKVLAERATAVSSGPISFTDCAVLSDFHSPDGSGQVEFGVVSTEELKFRLQHPVFGQLPKLNEVTPNSVHRPTWRPGRAQLPGSALFLDLNWWPSEDLVLKAGSDVTEALGRAEGNVRRLVEGLDGTV